MKAIELKPGKYNARCESMHTGVSEKGVDYARLFLEVDGIDEQVEHVVYFDDRVFQTKTGKTINSRDIAYGAMNAMSSKSLEKDGYMAWEDGWSDFTLDVSVNQTESKTFTNVRFYSKNARKVSGKGSIFDKFRAKSAPVAKVDDNDDDSIIPF
jgi:hypothetical protein